MILDVGGERWHLAVHHHLADNPDFGSLDPDIDGPYIVAMLETLEQHLKPIMMLLGSMMLDRLLNNSMLMLSRMMLLRLTLIGRFTAMRATLEKHPATRLGKLMRAASIAKVLLPVLAVLSVLPDCQYCQYCQYWRDPFY